MEIIGQFSSPSPQQKTNGLQSDGNMLVHTVILPTRCLQFFLYSLHRNETSKTIPPVIISCNSPTSQLFHVVQHTELRDTNKVLHPDGDILINTRLQTLTDCGLSLVQGVGLGQAGRCHQQCEGFQGEHGGDGDLRVEAERGDCCASSLPVWLGVSSEM